ncbi:MAG: NAD-dependent epimerase/dehydratase family protein [Candidatus Magasanikbacteria bacterium]
MSKILITGSNGFIGSNLKFRLVELGYVCIEFKKEDRLSEIEDILTDIDFIYHLAGVNRSLKSNDFFEGNSDLTRRLLELIKQKKLSIPIIFSSSIQAECENAYGKSKKLAEQSIFEYSKGTGAPVAVYRLPNIFGKWSKPDYNSFIATFCHNISRGLPIKIDNKDSIVDLVYIDDLVDEFVEMLQNGWNDTNQTYFTPKVRYSKSVGEVAEKIHFFNKNRSHKDLLVTSVGCGFDRALYATFTSFLEKDNFSYSLTKHEDERGVFAEFLKTEKSGQVSIFTAYPGVKRGGHYHRTKSEKFFVLKGSMLFRFRNILSGEIVEYEIADNEFRVVETPVGWAHSIENIGKEVAIALVWANEIFDKNNPDTTVFDV